MRYILLTLGLITVVSVYSQPPVWQQNKSFVDSLISKYRTKSGCSLTGSTLTQARKKRRLDLKLIEFLNTFYYGQLDSNQIEATLHRKFKMRGSQFGEKAVIDSFQVFKGRLRSFGNLEPFITYVVLNNEVIGTHITLRIRSYLDCLQPNDHGIADLYYLSDLIPDRINFPFELEGWGENFNSKVWIKAGVSVEVENLVRKLIGKNSDTPFNLRRLRTP